MSKLFPLFNLILILIYIVFNCITIHATAGMNDIPSHIIQKMSIQHLTNQDIQSLSTASKSIKNAIQEYLLGIKNVPLKNSNPYLLDLIHRKEPELLIVLLSRFIKEREWDTLGKIIVQFKLNDQITFMIKLIDHRSLIEPKRFQASMMGLFYRTRHIPLLISILKGMSNEHKIPILHSLPPILFCNVFPSLRSDLEKENRIDSDFRIIPDDHHIYIGQIKNNKPHGYGEMYEIMNEGYLRPEYIGNHFQFKRIEFIMKL